MLRNLSRLPLLWSLLGLAACIVGLAPRPALSAPAGVYVPGKMGIPQPEPKITLNINRRSLAATLYEIFKQTPYDYRVLSSVGGGTYTLNVQQASLSQTLKAVLAQQEERADPLVFQFTHTLEGRGQFIFAREFMHLDERNGSYRVTLAHARLTRVLPELFRLMEVRGRVAADVPPLPISVDLHPKNWRQAFFQVLLAAQKLEPALSYSRDGDMYVVHLHKTEYQPDSAAIRRITLPARDLPLRDAVAALLQGSKWKFHVSEAVRDVRVTVQANDEPELSVLRALLRQAGARAGSLTYREEPGVLYIEPGALPGELIEREAAPQQSRLTLQVQRTRLRALVNEIEILSGAIIKVSPTVPDLPVTFTVQNASLAPTLQAIIQALQPSLPNLTLRQDGEQFRLELQEP